MSFVINPGTIQPPLTAGGIAYGTGSAAKVSAAGTSAQVLQSNGASPPSWVTLSVSGGTVSSVAATVPSVFSISGSPITTSGTLAMTYSGTALPIANGGTGSTTLTANNVLLGNGTSALQAIAPSTSGNVLTSNGTTWASTNPPFSLIFLSSATATSSATVDLETTFDSTYDQYLITVSNMIPAINNREFGCKFKQNGAYVSTNYRCHTSQLLTSNAAYNALISNAYAFVRLGENVSNSYGSNFHLIVSSPTAPDNPSIFGHGTVFSASALVMTNVIPMGSQASTSGAVTGVRFLMDAGNITSGTFRLYGIKNS